MFLNIVSLCGLAFAAIAATWGYYRWKTSSEEERWKRADIPGVLVVIGLFSFVLGELLFGAPPPPMCVFPC